MKKKLMKTLDAALALALTAAVLAGLFLGARGWWQAVTDPYNGQPACHYRGTC